MAFWLNITFKSILVTFAVMWPKRNLAPSSGGHCPPPGAEAGPRPCGVTTKHQSTKAPKAASVAVAAVSSLDPPPLWSVGTEKHSRSISKKCKSVVWSWSMSWAPEEMIQSDDSRVMDSKQQHHFSASWIKSSLKRGDYVVLAVSHHPSMFSMKSVSLLSCVNPHFKRF